MKPHRNREQKAVILPLDCQWNNCNQQFLGEWQLNEHITKHLDEHLDKKLIDNVDEADNGDKGSNILVCLWNSCEFQMKCTREFRRHVYYHGYYKNLLEQGKYEQNHNPNLPACNKAEHIGVVMPLLDDDFYCRWVDCNRIFQSIVEFQDHILQHALFEYEIQKSPDDEKPKVSCSWELCNTILDNKYRLIEHIRKHTLRKDVACNRCGNIFRTKTTFHDHLRRQPQNNTHKYQCAQCFKYFSTEKLLRAHVVKHVNCFKCSMCDMTCCSASALATHIRYRHIKDRPFSCNDCDTRFVRKTDLVKHRHMVHCKQSYKCMEPGCEYSVRSPSQMRRHLLEVHRNTPIIYICHCCDKFLKSGKALSAHLKKKHDYQLPSGHKRFTYRKDEDGFYRLETMRIESLEVTEQILKPSSSEHDLNHKSSSESIMDNNTYKIVKMPETDSGNNIVVIANDLNLNDTVGHITVSFPSLS